MKNLISYFNLKVKWDSLLLTGGYLTLSFFSTAHLTCNYYIIFTYILCLSLASVSSIRISPMKAGMLSILVTVYTKHLK